MTLSGRPLLDTRQDARLFVDREEQLTQIRTALAHGLNCAVVGDRGAGKTTLLRALMYRARTQSFSVFPRLVYVRGSDAETPTEVLERVIDAVDLARASTEVVRPIRSSRDLLQQLESRAAQADNGLVLALDDVPSAVGNALFGSRRDDLWALGAQWLVTVSTDDAGDLLRPPADAFFEARADIDAISDSVAVELLARRMPDHEPELLSSLAAAANGNPRQILDLARALLGGRTQWPELSTAYAARKTSLANQGRPAHMLFQELEAIGSASASDQRLQERMGWTRVRLVQVLGQLENAGLVEAQMVKPVGGKGRPRKVFHPVSPVDFAHHPTSQGL